MPKISLPIPENTKLEVKIGDKVKIGDTLAVAKRQGELKALELATLLKVSPQKARSLLAVPIGSKVERGQMVAKKQNLFGLSRTLVLSPFSGSLSLFDDKTGKLYIREKTDEVFKIASKIEGRIWQIRQDSIAIETQNEVVFAQFGFGPETEGELLLQALLGKWVLGKIIVIENLQRLMLFKAFALGAHGAIGSTMREEDLLYVQDRGLPFPCLLVSTDDLEKIKGWAGRQASLFPEEKMVVIL